MAVPVLSFNSRHQQKCSQSFSSLIIPRTLPAQLLPPVETSVCMVLEPEAEQVFHPDSYGYRPGRSALQAVATARRRGWENDWVIDMDIRAFFDTVPWDLVLRAVRRHTRQAWILLYVRRWLEAPLQRPDGTVVSRTMGTPQG